MRIADLVRRIRAHWQRVAGKERSRNESMREIAVRFVERDGPGGRKESLHPENPLNLDQPSSVAYVQGIWLKRKLSVQNVPSVA